MKFRSRLKITSRFNRRQKPGFLPFILPCGFRARNRVSRTTELIPGQVLRQSTWLLSFLAVTTLLLNGCSAPATATPTVEVLPSVTPTPSINYVRLKNAASGNYLYEAEGQAKLAELSASDPAFDWVIE